MTEPRLVSSENYELLQKIAKCSEIFFLDVMPQVGGLCIQDFANLNELGMALEKWRRTYE